MEKKILLSLFLLFGTIGISFAQSDITQLHNGDSSWLDFLQNNLASVTLDPEKAASSPLLETTLSAPVPTNQMLFNALSTTPALQPDAIQTKTYRWGNTEYIITVFSVKRLEIFYQRELINNKAK